MALASVWLTKAIHFPSGDHAGELSAPGLVVILDRCAPLSSEGAPAERATLSAVTVQIPRMTTEFGTEAPKDAPEDASKDALRTPQGPPKDARRLTIQQMPRLTRWLAAGVRR